MGDDIRAERDALRRLPTDVYTAMYPPPGGAPGPVDHTEIPAHVAALRAERDRLRAALQRLHRYYDPDTVPECGAMGVIGSVLSDAGLLDGSGVMGGDPVDAERQRIWSTINAWEEPAHAFHPETGELVATDITHKPLAPFFDELRRIVFDDD